MKMGGDTIRAEICGMPTFKKRSGTTDRGKDYEHLFIAEIILKLITDESISDFRISSNDEIFGAFDDVILETESTDGTKANYAFQLKHSNRPLTEQNLSRDTGDFSIKKYFDSFKNEIEKNEIENFKFIIFTNRQFEDKHEKQIVIDNRKMTILMCESEKILNKFCSEDYCYKFQSVVSDESDKLHKCFFNNFFLYTNQANVTKMQENVFNTMYNLFSCERNIFVEYLSFITEWSLREGHKEKINKNLMKAVITVRLLSPFIELFTPTIINEKSKILKQAISSFNITIFDKENCDEVKKIWGDLRDHLPNIKQINEIGLRYQIIPRYIKDENVLTDEECTKILWLMHTCPLIVIENKKTSKAIQLSQDKKYILLGDGSSLNNLTVCSKFRNLSDLNPKWQISKKLLKTFHCKLQEKQEISLKCLLESNDNFLNFISTNELIMMLNEPLNIGKDKEILPIPYFDRILSSNIIDPKFLDKIDINTVIVLNCLEENSFKLNHHLKMINTEDFLKMKNWDCVNYNIVISNYECSQNTFDEICCKIPERKKCHQIKELPDGKFEWVRSKGAINELQNYRSEEFRNGITKEWESDSYINIICADPGMGKSVLMKNLKNMYLPHFWTIMIYPKDHSKCFSEINNDVNAFKNYIIAKQQYTNFELKFLEILKKTNQIVYIWDGLDEVSDENLEIVLNLIKELSKEKCRQYITSRNTLKNLLENKFNTFSKTLKEFDEEEQRNYIKQRLDCPEDEFEDIFKKIKNNIQLRHFNDTLGIPLQIYMLTELICQNSSKYKNMLDNIFSMTDLYRYFVDEKFNVFFKEKMGFDNSNEITMKHNHYYKLERLENYEKIAMETYFKKDILKGFDTNCTTFLTEIQKEKDDVGIIIQISEEKTVTFLHNSYGEYFVASYLAKHWQNFRTIENIFFEQRFSNIRFLFDLILAEDCPAHTAVLYKNLEQLKKCEMQSKDKAGRNPLHLACTWGAKYPPLKFKKSGWIKVTYTVDVAFEANIKITENPENRNILEFLLKNYDPQEKDKLLNLSPFGYADKALCLMPLEILAKRHNINFNDFEHFNDTCTVVFYSIKYDYSNILKSVKNIPWLSININWELYSFWNIIAYYGAVKCLRYLLSTKKYIKDCNQLCKDGNKVMHIACQRGHYKMVELLIKHNIDVNAIDADGNTPLHRACYQGHYEIVQLLLKNNANINVYDVSGNSPLHTAFDWKEFEIVELLIQHNANVDIADKHGRIPIHRALNFKQYKIVEKLIKHNAYINIADDDGNTPLYKACDDGQYEIVNLLLQYNADVNITNKHGNAPIHKACTMGHTDIVKSLIEYNANINAISKNGRIPIIIACNEGEYEIVKLLAEHNADLSVTDKKGNTCLHKVCQDKHYEIVKLLLAHGADINAVNNNGYTPLHKASIDRQYEIVKLLVEHNADVNISDSDGRTPIHDACSDGQYEIVKLFIEHNADINVVDRYRDTPIFKACIEGQYEIVQLLIEHNANLNVVDSRGSTPLHQACDDGHYEIVKLMIDCNADVNCEDFYGDTPLCQAFYHKRYEIVKLLLQHNADINVVIKNQPLIVNIVCSDGHYELVKLLIENNAEINNYSANYDTPIHQVINNGKFEIAKLLLEHGVDFNIADQDGFTPLFKTCREGQYEITKLFLENGADVNATDNDNITPIHGACDKEEYEIVKLLVKFNADLNVVDRKGYTPLHKTCRNGQYEITKFLIENNADINAKDKIGNTPLHIACYEGHYEIVKLLIENNADISIKNRNNETPINVAYSKGRYPAVMFLEKYERKKKKLLNLTSEDFIAASNIIKTNYAVS